MIPPSHPYWHVRALVERRQDVVAVPVSYYTYVPQTVKDSRTSWLVPREDFLRSNHVEDIMNATPSGCEMAVHSDIRTTSNERVHLVMVDMSTSAKAHLDKLRAFLDETFFQRIAWYNSGRSFHGYGETMLLEAEWVRFMGLLLLANKPRLEHTVDPRWIGHRLVAGHAALRWTRNTAHYLATPEKLAGRSRLQSTYSEVGPVGHTLRRKSSDS